MRNSGRVSESVPRGLQFIRAAIAIVRDLDELAKLREFAREQWGHDPVYAELEERLGRRRAEIEGRPDIQIPLPLDGTNG